MATDPAPFGPWSPLSPQDVATLFASLDAPWWIAGGYAIDLFLGRTTRDHADIDVQVLRRDQRAIRLALDGWDVQEVNRVMAISPEKWPFRSWERESALSAGVHDVWCRPHAKAPWALQLMIADTEEDDWLFRRLPQIRRPIANIGRRTPDGIPYIAPEIQLLYKAKEPQGKNEADFLHALLSLDPASRQWLAHALAITHPGHAWFDALSEI